MNQRQIKVGKNYRGKMGPLTRFVLEISHAVRPGTALTTGVRYRTSEGHEGTAYLDTFAAWAHREVKL